MNPEIAPLTTDDIERASKSFCDTNELFRAVKFARDEIDEFITEFAEASIPENHGEYLVSTVIWKDDDYVCLYVDVEVWHATIDLAKDEDGISPEAADAIPGAFNAFARRKGAYESVLGTMDTIILPRTDYVEQLIEERR